MLTKTRATGLDKPTLFSCNVTRDEISLMTKKRTSLIISKLSPSICSLVIADFGLPVDSDLWFFNRLALPLFVKSGQGEGSFLMKAVCPILDERRITVFNEINPYGDLNLEQLVKFYKKYGNFEFLRDNAMVRYPLQQKVI